jgi:HSP20 family protein
MLFLPAARRGVPVAFSSRFDSVLDDTLEQFFRGAAAPQGATRAPAMDISESDAAYTVTLDVPGLTREQLKVSVEGKRVSIDAEDVAEAAPQEGVSRLYSERSTRRYARSFTLPAEVDQDSSQAKLEHGVLTLTLAKKVANGARQISIN